MKFQLDTPILRPYVRPMWRIDVVAVGDIEEEQLVEVPDGMAVMPWNPTISTITPTGEEGDVTWLAFAYKTLPLTIRDELKDEAGKEYAIKYLKEWADFYELGLN